MTLRTVPWASTRACCAGVSTGNISSGEEPGKGVDMVTPLHQQVFYLHWQFANTNAGRMVNGTGDRRRDPGEPDLADPTSAEFVDLFIGIVEEVDVNRRRV